MQRNKQNNISKVRRVAGVAGTVLALLALSPAARAQSTPISFFSGDTAGMNLKRITNGVASSENTVSVSYATGYDNVSLLLSGSFTPTPSPGGGNTYSPTALVTNSATISSFINGPVTNAGILTSYSSADMGGSAGYYLYQVAFTLTGTTQNYGVSGAIHSDNEIYDVILDYNTVNARRLALSGTNIRDTANLATTDGAYSGNITAGSHTLSYITYNSTGATATSFSFAADTPEPGTLVLLGAVGVPCLAETVLARRRKRNAK